MIAYIYSRLLSCLSVLNYIQARRRQLATHENLKDVAHPAALYNVNVFQLSSCNISIGTLQSVLNTQQATLTRYNEAMLCDLVSTSRLPFRLKKFLNLDIKPDHDVAGRCETVLNTTMAEFDTYHQQKVEDFKRIATEHLDGEIEFYEQVGD